MRPGPKRWRVGSWLLQGAVMVLVVVVVMAFQMRNMLATDRQAAPPLAGVTLAGDAFRLGAAGGRPALVYFFAPWCKICGASADNVERLQRLVGDDGVEIVIVALDYGDVQEVRDYAERHGLADTVVLGDRRIAADWKIYAFPTYYVLDSQHRVARRDLGYSTQFGLLLRIWSVDWFA